MSCFMLQEVKKQSEVSEEEIAQIIVDALFLFWRENHEKEVVK